jgi:hypothetical protein
MDARADALFEARRSDARTGAQLRPDPQAAQPARAEVRIEGRQPEVRTGALSARDTTLARPVGIIRGESRPEWHPKQQLARAEPRARIEAPRAPQPRMEIRPVQNVARRESTAMAVARNEPPMNAARAEIRPAQAVSRQGPGAGAKAMARPRMGP